MNGGNDDDRLGPWSTSDELRVGAKNWDHHAAECEREARVARRKADDLRARARALDARRAAS